MEGSLSGPSHVARWAENLARLHQAFVPRGSDAVIELLPAGGSPAVGPRHVYWTATDGEPRLLRLCRDALPAR